MKNKIDLRILYHKSLNNYHFDIHFVEVVILLLVSPISIVFSKATLSKVNFEVEKKKNAIKDQEKTNESISMTINELASLTKIQAVAEEQGLSYNNDNIKRVTED